MKNHFIDEVNVIIDGEKSEIVTITGAGSYNPNIVKNKAIEMIKENLPDSKLAAVILNHKEVSVEEYKNIIGSNPPRLFNID